MKQQFVDAKEQIWELNLHISELKQQIALCEGKKGIILDNVCVAVVCVGVVLGILSCSFYIAAAM